MFKELIEKNRFCFHDGFDTWQEAVEASCQPLLSQGAITPEYVAAIIRNVTEYGPYIVIAPDICIPHAQQGLGVNETAISFMRTARPVHFSEDPEQDARLFFVLASINNDDHLKNLQAMVEAVSDSDQVAVMLAATCPEDLATLP
ncbi:MAG: PTS sugar transporter subunit IIA [Clostridiales bacterium]|jgi:PTS system ascorbate-specific IIA component|nr:PTS sugar transporter subunit IIA [Clostridiales bacterium]